jgi:hypothetical protein
MSNTTTAAQDTVASDVPQREQSVSFVGVPLTLFVVMATLACLGCVYSLSLIAFYVFHRNNKLIKMTSPNINIVILSGTILGYISIVVLGLDRTFIRDGLDVDSALQGCTYLLIFSFTLVYGSLFAKVCRVFMIFSNLSFNGKSSRDEHLLLAVAALLLLDLGVLLPWQLVDPVRCTTWLQSTSQLVEPSTTNATTSTPLLLPSFALVESCTSRLQIVWISVIYGYKTLMLVVGLYFTWNTRQVTLPALRDAAFIATTVLIVVIVSLIALPTLLTSTPDADQSVRASGGGTTSIVRYAVGSLCVWFGLVSTVSLLAIPKIVLLRRSLIRQKADSTSNGGQTVEDSQLQFSESMRRTRDSATKGLCGWCCTGLGQGGGTGDDRYAVDVLATEIDTLQRTVKEKEATIRELTDRLFVGAEQFQRYLVTSSSRGRDRAAAYRINSQQQLQQQQCQSPHAPAPRFPPDIGGRIVYPTVAMATTTVNGGPLPSSVYCNNNSVSGREIDDVSSSDVSDDDYYPNGDFEARATTEFSPAVAASAGHVTSTPDRHAPPRQLSATDLLPRCREPADTVPAERTYVRPMSASTSSLTETGSGDRRHMAMMTSSSATGLQDDGRGCTYDDDIDDEDDVGGPASVAAALSSSGGTVVDRRTGFRPPASVATARQQRPPSGHGSSRSNCAAVAAAAAPGGPPTVSAGGPAGTAWTVAVDVHSSCGRKQHVGRRPETEMETDVDAVTTAARVESAPDVTSSTGGDRQRRWRWTDDVITTTTVTATTTTDTEALNKQQQQLAPRNHKRTVYQI